MLSTSICLFTSCNSNNEKTKKKKATAAVISQPYELLIVADKTWLATDGMEFRQIVDRPIIGLPQPESNFRITTLNPRDFKGKFTMYGNIFIAKLDQEYKETKCIVEHNVNARPQVIITIESPSTNDMMVYLETRKDSILDIFNENELAREKSILKKHNSSQLSTQVKKQFNIDIHAPEEIDIVYPHENFIWATSESKASLNLCIYTYPYTGEENFTLENFINKRDSVMKIRVQGNKEGQYMKTDSRYVFESASINGNNFIYKVRGLWIMVNDAMGGPFVSYARLDKLNNRIVVAEGFVFAPDEKKRPLIRKLEAALQTVEIPQ